MRFAAFLLMLFMITPAAAQACGCGSSKCQAPAAGPSSAGACNGCGMPNCAPAGASPGSQPSPSQS